MRRSAVLFLVGFFLTLFVSPASQIEFIAELDSKSTEGEVTILTMALTPSFSIDVQVTPATEIEDDSDNPISVDDLMPGMFLKIEGVFVDGGILALEIEVTDDENQFEVKGVLTSVTPDGGGSSGAIGLAGLEIQVPAEAEITNSEGDELGFSDLMVGQFVKVEGNAVDGDLVASEVKVRTDELDEAFARVRLQGIVSEILDETTFLVELEGGPAAMVEIDEDTRILGGELAVGAFVKVFGRLTEELTVLADRVIVQKSVRLEPEELELAPDEKGTVTIVLRTERDSDVEFFIIVRDDSVAMALVDTLTIPAGQLVGSFEVMAGTSEGETKVDVETDGFAGTVDVEVEEQGEADEEDGDLQIRWDPRVIRAAPDLVREVRLRLSDPAPEELTVMLEISEGDDDFFTFPEEVVFPAGSRTQIVLLEFLSTQGEAELKAELPEALGGDDAELDIDLRPPLMDKIQLAWSPTQVEAEPDEEVEAELRIDRPAPFDLEITLTVIGRPGVLQGVPGSVMIEEGETSVEVEFETGEHVGNGKLRAGLPIGVGGRHADLDVRIRLDE